MTEQPHAAPILGVFLSETFDLKGFYGPAFAAQGGDVMVCLPAEVTDPAQVRFAVCWHPAEDAFARFPALEMASVVGAGVDGLLGHPNLPGDLRICRVRDDAQASQMAGYVVHEVLHRVRDFGRMAHNAARQHWAPEPIGAPADTVVAVLGAGSMGAAVMRALVSLGFSVRVASRSRPQAPVPGAAYHFGPGAIETVAEGADFLVNVLPLTAETRGVLNREPFARMAPGGWLIQIGRGEHLVGADLLAALDAGTLAGATLDVFETEPLPADHPFWADPRLRITPHVASIASPATTAAQIVQSARELRDGVPLTFEIDTARGY